MAGRIIFLLLLLAGTAWADTVVTWGGKTTIGTPVIEYGVVSTGTAVVGDAILELKDEFEKALAAGSVNGTKSLTQHTRTVTDTESKISLSGGRLSFSGGKTSPTWNDPAVWYPVIQRTPGTLMLTHRYTQSSTNLIFGFSTDQAGTNLDGTYLGTSDQLYLYLRGATVPLLDNMYGGYSYDWYLGLALRTQGFYFFAKPEMSNGKWKLMYPSSSFSNSPLYPNINQHMGTGSSRFFRMPSLKWLPSPLLSDGFGGSWGSSDGAGHAETTGLGSGGGSLAYSTQAATWGITATQAHNNPTRGATFWDGPAGVFTSGTYGWAGVGSNTIANVSNQLQITYVDHNDGALVYLNAASDLSSNLTVGKWYEITGDVKINTADVYVSASGAFQSVQYIPWTTMQPFTLTMLASNATSNYLALTGFGAGEIVTIDNLAIKEITIGELFATRNLGTPNVVASVEMTLTQFGHQGGLVLNLDNPSNPQNFILVAKIDSYLQVIKYVNGVHTVVTGNTPGLTQGAKLEAVRDGSSLLVYYNEVYQFTATISDAQIINNTYHGTFATGTSVRLDNLLYYARGNEGQYSILDQFIQ